MKKDKIKKWVHCYYSVLQRQRHSTEPDRKIRTRSWSHSTADKSDSIKSFMWNFCHLTVSQCWYNIPRQWPIDTGALAPPQNCCGETHSSLSHKKIVTAICLVQEPLGIWDVHWKIETLKLDWYWHDSHELLTWNILIWVALTPPKRTKF